MMTGFHQNYIGANQHREHDKQPLPHGIKPIPHLLREAGYFTALDELENRLQLCPQHEGRTVHRRGLERAKPGPAILCADHFRRDASSVETRSVRPIDIEDVELPPYYPDTPFFVATGRTAWNKCSWSIVRSVSYSKRLDDEGLADNTIVFFIGDHGRCHIRGKQFLYDGGIRIPMIMRWPGKVEPGQVSDDLVMSIDICATILDAAGVKPPVPLHGKNLLSDDVKQRKYVFAARDKMDETHDAMRAVRSRDHKLILNLMPERPWCQFNRYKEGSYPVLAEMNVLNLQGKLTPQQAAFFAASKPAVELFDLNNDPHEVANVADDPAYADVKRRLLAELANWRTSVIEDQGVSDDFRASRCVPQSEPIGHRERLGGNQSDEV